MSPWRQVIQRVAAEHHLVAGIGEKKPACPGIEELRNYSRAHHLGYVDYYAAMTGGALGMRATLSADGVHPMKQGYQIMDRIAASAIEVAQHPRQGA